MSEELNFIIYFWLKSLVLARSKKNPISTFFIIFIHSLIVLFIFFHPISYKMKTLVTWRKKGRVLLYSIKNHCRHTKKEKGFWLLRKIFVMVIKYFLYLIFVPLEHFKCYSIEILIFFWHAIACFHFHVLQFLGNNEKICKWNLCGGLGRVPWAKLKYLWKSSQDTSFKFRLIGSSHSIDSPFKLGNWSKSFEKYQAFPS